VIRDIDAFLYKEGLQNPEAINKPLKKDLNNYGWHTDHIEAACRV